MGTSRFVGRVDGETVPWAVRYRHNSIIGYGSLLFRWWLGALVPGWCWWDGMVEKGTLKVGVNGSVYYFSPIVVGFA